MSARAEVATFSKSAVDALVANEILAVRLADFAGRDEMVALSEALLSGSVRTNSIPTVTRLGISQFEQGIRDSKQAYFAQARELAPTFERIYADSFSPLDRFVDALDRLGFDTAVMTEPGFGPYWAGNGKLRTGTTPIHVDFSPQDSPGWAVGDVTAQLSWNLYLECDPDGDLLIWDRSWSPEDDVHLVAGEYYYHPAVVQDAELMRIRPAPGEVLLVNSRNYHRVAECEHRLAFGSFVGVVDTDTLRLWS